MENAKLTVKLIGEARTNFDGNLHQFLENDKMTVTSSRCWIDESKRKDFCEADIQLLLDVVCGHDDDLFPLVTDGVNHINKIYPGMACIVE